MLKNLFSRIKSEKSSTIKNDDKNQHSQNKEQNYCKQINETLQTYNFQDENKMSTYLSQQSDLAFNIVKGQIRQIRYWSNKQIPNIFAKVLSCPISHYNLLPHSKRKVKEIDLKVNKLPSYLLFMKQLLQKQLPTYNHILINHYPKGIGIMHHFDGPLYRDKVIVLSLGGPALISFQEGYSKDTQSMKILLQDKSIHIFEKDTYSKFLHGIEDNKVDSFTFKIIQLHSQAKIYDQSYIFKLKTKSASEEQYFISQSSIGNMEKLQSINALIQNQLQRLVFKSIPIQKQKYCIQFNEFDSVHKLKGCFLFIKQEVDLKNQSWDDKCQWWKWKIQIERQQRISITIRQKYQSSES